MHITPELSHLIDIVAEGQMHFLLAARGTNPGTPERAEHLQAVERSVKKAREIVTGMGGLKNLPAATAVALRICELGLERLGGPKAPPKEEV